MRPAVLSNPSWEATRMNHPLPIKPYTQPAFAMSGRSTTFHQRHGFSWKLFSNRPFLCDGAVY